MNTETMGNSWTGRVIEEQFTLLRQLGGKGESSLFLAELQGHPSQKAAVRLIPANAEDADARMAAWALAAHLSHPHVARMFHSGHCSIDGTPMVYGVTDYADEILSQILPERALTADETGEMLGPVIDALGYLHEKGIAHGRVKPANILVVDDQLKLCCDNLQTAGSASKLLLQPEIYDAPELAKGTISPAADIWSLGVTLVEALTQHPPTWKRSTLQDPEVPASVPQPFAGIARECLRIDPQQRCTLGDIQQRLEPDTASSQPRGAFPLKPRMMGLVAVVAILVCVVSLLLLRSRQPAPASSSDDQQTVSTPATESHTPKTERSHNGLVKGAVVERVLPEVPEAASETIRGAALLNIRVHVDADGHASEASLDSPGASRYFGNLAQQAALRWKFKPARIDGAPVPSVWELHFAFHQDEIDVTPMEESPQ